MLPLNVIVKSALDLVTSAITVSPPALITWQVTSLASDLPKSVLVSIVHEVAPPTVPFAVTAPELAPNEYLWPFDAVEPGSLFVTVNIPFDTDTLIPLPAATLAAPIADAVASSIPIVTLPDAPPPFIGAVTPTLVISPWLLVNGKSTNAYLTVSPVPLLVVATNTSSSSSGLPAPLSASSISPPLAA